MLTVYSTSQFGHTFPFTSIRKCVQNFDCYCMNLLHVFIHFNSDEDTVVLKYVWWAIKGCKSIIDHVILYDLKFI